MYTQNRIGDLVFNILLKMGILGKMSLYLHFDYGMGNSSYSHSRLILQSDPSKTVEMFGDYTTYYYGLGIRKYFIEEASINVFIGSDFGIGLFSGTGAWKKITDSTFPGGLREEKEIYDGSKVFICRIETGIIIPIIEKNGLVLKGGYRFGGGTTEGKIERKEDGSITVNDALLYTDVSGLFFGVGILINFDE